VVVIVKRTQEEPNILRVDNEWRSCLHYACVGGHLGCVQLLLDYQAPVYLKDKVKLPESVGPQAWVPISHHSVRHSSPHAKSATHRQCDVRPTVALA